MTKFQTRALLLAVFCLLSHGIVRSQITYRTVPNDPLHARIYTLPNGLTVMMSQNKNEARIQTAIAVRAGSKNDPSDATGLAHYLEHMLFKGTDRFGSLDFSREKPLIDSIEQRFEIYRTVKDPARRKMLYHQIDSLSGEAARFAIANEYDKMLSAIGGTGSNAYTSLEQTVYISDIPANQLNNWLRVESERFRNPVLRLFHTELEAVYEEKNRTLDNDDDQVFDEAMRQLASKHPYGTQTTIGTIEHLKNPSMRKIREYYNAYYVPNNMAVILSGDIDFDLAIQAVAKAFGDLPSGAVPSFAPPKEPELKSVIVRDVWGPAAASVNLGFRLPGLRTREAKVARVIDQLLVNGTAGLIDLNLLQSQKVLGATTWYWPNQDYSFHFVTGRPKDGQSLDQVRKLLVDQIDLLKKGKFSDEGLKAVVTNMTIGQIRQFESNWGRVSDMIEAFTTGMDWEEQVRLLDELGTITRKEIADVAQKYYKNYVVVNKREGKKKNAVQVQKPEITPVEMNREAESQFVTDVTSSPASQIAPRFLDFTSDIASEKLKNGAELRYLRNSENPLFTMYYVLDMGNRHDRLMPFAIEYLEFLGTDKMTADELKTKMYGLGSSFSVSSGDDKAYVEITGLQKNFRETLQLFEDLLAHPKPDPVALAALVGNTLQEREDAKKDKNTILFTAMMNYGQYGARNPFTNILSKSELEKLTADQLVEKIKALTTYEHRVLYYGPAEASEVASDLNQLHRMPTTLKPIPAAQDYHREETAQNRVYVVHYPMEQAEIMMLSKSVNYDPAREPVLSLYNEYFGGSMASIVFQTIRESKALAYSAWSNFTTPTKSGEPYYNFAYVGTQADKLPETMHSMFELFSDMPKAEKLFLQSKDAIRKRLETERITRMAILWNYENALKHGLTYDIRKDVYAKLPALTLEDVSAMQNELVKGKAYNILILGEKNKLDPAVLAKYGPVTYLSLEDIFGY